MSMSKRFTIFASSVLLALGSFWAMNSHAMGNATNEVDQRLALWLAAERDATVMTGTPPQPPMSAKPAYFVDDPDFYFYWRQDDPAQDCFPNLYCEIVQVDMYVARNAPASLVALGSTDRPTNASLPTSSDGRVAVYLDTSGNADWDYATIAPNRYFGPDTYYDWWMYYWNGSDWIRMNVPATWYRSDYFWGAIMPWRSLDITAANLTFEICDTNGQCDLAPDNGTGRIEIKGAVDGLLPNAPSSLTTNYAYKKNGRASATVTWLYSGPGGPNSIVNYSFRASGNNGATWTPWKSTTNNRAIVTGLRKGQRGLFEVKAQNRSGYGPVARVVLRP